MYIKITIQQRQHLIIEILSGFPADVDGWLLQREELPCWQGGERSHLMNRWRVTRLQRREMTLGHVELELW